MAGILDLMGYIQDQGDRGRAQGQQSKLAQLYSGALQAPREQRQDYLAQMAAVSPQSAMEVEQGFNRGDDRGFEQFSRLSTAYVTTRDPGIGRQWAQAGVQAGMLPAEAATKDFNNPADLEGSLMAAQAYAQAFSKNGVPAGYQEFDMLARDANLSPEDRATAARRALYLERRPSNAATGYKMAEGEDGRTRLVATDPNGAGAQVVGGPSAGMDGNPFYASVESVVAPLGGRITSTTGGQHNPGSLHPQGGAVDIGMAQESPEEQARMIAALESAGYKVRDERQRPPGQQVWSGPHLHVEGGGVNPFASRTKEAEAAAVEAAKAGVQTNTAAGIEANKQFGQDAGKAYTALQEAGRAGTKERARLAILRDELKDTYTGPGANMLIGMKRVANAFGIKVDGLGEAETARALSNQLALSLRNPAGGEGMPGAMSDADRAFLQQSVPSLSNSPQGWRAMVDMRLALADAAVKQAQYAEQLRRRGVPIQDIPGMVQDFANQNPVFGGAVPQQPAQQAPVSGGFKVLD